MAHVITDWKVMHNRLSIIVIGELSALTDR